MSRCGEGVSFVAAVARPYLSLYEADSGYGFIRAIGEVVNRVLIYPFVLYLF